VYYTFGEKLTRAVEHILSLHPGQRGLIHCVSYERGAFLEEILGRHNKRLRFHGRGAKDFDYACQLHRQTPGSVLVSARALEGIDFKGDASEFQIFLKIPYPAQTAWVKRRMDPWYSKHPNPWYPITTTIHFLQGTGRSVRCMSDVAPTYVLDVSWPRFLNNTNKFLPDYIKAAIQPYQPKEAACSVSSR
jgi:Rad3-related DNA helicase